MNESKIKKIAGIVWVIVIMTSIAGATTISDTTSSFSDDVSITGNIAVTGTVDGVDIAALNTIVGGVTAAEMDQIENIGATIISLANWGFLASMNQAVATTSSVTHNNMILSPSGAQKGLFLDQNNDVYSIEIDSEATTQPAMYIDILDASTGSAASIYRSNSDYAEFVRSTASSTGSNVIYRNFDSSNTAGPVIKIDQNNAGDDQGTVLIENAGTGIAAHIVATGGGKGLFIDQNGDAISIDIDSEAITEAAINLDVTPLSTKTGIYLTKGGVTNGLFLLRSNTSIEGTNYILRNLPSYATAGPVVNIVQDNIADDQITLRIQQDGDAASIRIFPKTTAPTACIQGDVYVDTSGAYCFCSSTNTWENLASAGTCV